MKKLVFIILQFFLLTTATAKPVGEKKAMDVAKKFLAAQTSRDIQLKTVSLPDTLKNALFVFSDESAGYVIISADDCAIPILGYSTESAFTLPIPDIVADWLYGYVLEIEYIREHGIQTDSTILNQWENPSLTPKTSEQTEDANAVAPLIQTLWNQSPYYNNLCPSDGSGRALTGCVATATAQIMRYWSHPQVGTGSHSYTHSRYGTLSANFGSTSYDWSNMPIRLTSSSTSVQINAVATLMYHVGVAVNMNYGTNGSSSSSANAANALKSYFKYDPNLRYENKSDYPDSIWQSLIKLELNAGHPLLYRGTQGSSGHCFICDGYDNLGRFHFNWGWGGSRDGYFYIGNLNPGSYTFNSYNGAVFGIMPMSDTVGIVDISAQSNNISLGNATVDGLSQGTFSIGDTVELLATALSESRFVRWSDGVMNNPRQYIISGNQSVFVAEFEPISGDTVYYHNGLYNGYNYNSYNQPWGIRIPASELGGRDTLKGVMLYNPAYTSRTCNLRVYSGLLPADSTLIHSQSITANTVTGWCAISLDNAVVVPLNQNLWILVDMNYIPKSPYCGNMNGSIIKQSGNWRYNTTYSWLVSAIFSHSDSWEISVQANPTTSGYVAGGGRKSASNCQNIQLIAYANDGYRFSHWSDGTVFNPRYDNIVSDTFFTAFFEPQEGDTLHHDGGLYSFSYTGSWVSTAFAPSVINGNNRLNDIQMYSTAANQQKNLRVYHGDADHPETLLLDTTVTSVTANGWDTIPLSPSIILDTTQWLWIALDGNNADVPLSVFSGNNHSRMHSIDGLAWSPLTQYGSLMLRGVLSHNETPTYTLHANVTNSTHGSVTGSGSYLGETMVTMLATPAACYRFVSWSDGNTDNPRILSLTSDSSITALFARKQLNGEESAEACDRYTWHGQTYTSVPSIPPTYTYITPSGCDSVVTLNLTLGQTSHRYDTIITCDSIMWNGVVYYSSNSSISNLIHSDSSCDTIVHLHLTVNESKRSYFSEQACDSLQWHGKTYRNDTTAYYNTVSTNGCDSVVSISITINNSLHSSDTIDACGRYYWHGQLYTETPAAPLVYTVNNTNCTQADTLHLTIHQATSSTDTFEACDSVIWHGTKYSYSTNRPTYKVPEGNMYGCDSIVHLNLTIRHSSNSLFTSLRVCDSTSLFGQTYTEDTTISHIWHNANSQGCDSTERIWLYVNKTTHNASYMVTCENFYWHGQVLTQTPDTPLVYSYNDWYGCTSTDTLHLTIHQPSSSFDTIVACDSIIWHGRKYTYSAVWPTYDVPEGNINGCDSTVHLNLTIHRSSNSPYSTMRVCDSTALFGQMYYDDTTVSHILPNSNIHGCDSTERILLYVYHTSHTATIVDTCGQYYWHFHNYTQTPDTPVVYSNTNYYGCTSTDTLHLTIHHASSSIETVEACNSYTWHGNTYNHTTSTPSFSTTGIGGCDSTVTLHLTIHNNSSSYADVSACNSFTWIDGITYTSSTSAPTFTAQTIHGCDSVITLHLTINDSLFTIETIAACDSCAWHGTTYSASTETPTYSTSSVEGCDSIVTLHLTINHSSSSSDSITACDSYLWHGTTYTSSTITPTYHTTNAVGCDSTVSLYLIINHSSSCSETITACDNYSWHGTVFASSTNTPTYDTTNAVGCDSVVTLNLTINHSSSSSETITACDSSIWHGNTYFSSSNTLTFDTLNSAGCDSTVTLHLTINHSAETTISETVDDSFIWHGVTYTESGVYQWNGTTEGGCDSTVTLILTVNHVGIDDVVNDDNNIMVYPNPTTGWITIDAENVISVEVFDQTGRKMSTHNRTNPINLEGLSSGNYILKIHFERGISIQRIILH